MTKHVVMQALTNSTGCIFHDPAVLGMDMRYNMSNSEHLEAACALAAVHRHSSTAATLEFFVTAPNSGCCHSRWPAGRTQSSIHQHAGSMPSRTCQRSMLLCAAVALSAAIFADAEVVQVGFVATCLTHTSEAYTQLDSPEAACPAEHWPPLLSRSCLSLIMFITQPPECASSDHLLAGDMRQRDQGAAQRHWCPAALARHHVRLRKRAAERHRLLRRRRRQQLLDRARHRGTPWCSSLRWDPMHFHVAQTLNPTTRIM
jgi:hypothetical protein